MTSDQFSLWLATPDRRPLIVGIINVTPDSFSDGGLISGPDAAADRAEQLLADGADWLDIGGESTRPGAAPVPVQEQLRRTTPAVAAICRRLDAPISIDTTSSAVAQAALDSGASIVNDVSAGKDDPDMLPVVARHRARLVLMHMQGTPRTMQLSPSYQDVTAEVSSFLLERRSAATGAGIDPNNLLFDPGLGFGKTLQHDLVLVRDTRRLAALGQPLLVGPSRKRFIGDITGITRPQDRVFGTAAVVAWCIANGAAAVRVHDVAPIKQVVDAIRAIASSG